MLIASQVAHGKPMILHWPHLADSERQTLHGTGTHTPIESLVVGQATTVTFRFVVGKQPVAAGGRLLVVWRWPFDWSDLQTDDPTAAGYVVARHVPVGERTPTNFNIKYNWIAGIEPWHHQLLVQVSEPLESGDVVEITCGDQTHGGAGWFAPTCVADRCRFLMLIDHEANGRRNRLVPTPTFGTKPGPPRSLHVIASADAVVDQAARVIVRADDQWGNPTRLDSSLLVACDGEAVIEPSAETSLRPVTFYDLRFTRSGVSQVRAECAELQLATESAPIRVHESTPEQQLLWGDLHSGQTEIGCGCGSLGEHYAFARDCAGLEFITHQANDHYVTAPEWEETRTVTQEFYEPGRFVPLLGCEWSPLTKDGGDRNVFYADDDPILRRSDRFFIEDPVDDTPDIPTAPNFHDAFRDRDVLVNIHVGGRMTNLDWYEPKIERLCETHSTHGTVEWFFKEALARGYKVGFTAGTDGVMGRPGACHPGRRLIRNSRNGLTAVYARDRSRESVWAALQARRCYATTGERIWLRFEVDGQPMGSDYVPSNDKMTICVDVLGTTAIERVDLFCGAELVDQWQVAAPVNDPQRFRFVWGGTERKGTARLQRVVWDGQLSIDSGRLGLVESVNFQSIDDRAWQETEQLLCWSSSTAGGAAGLVVDIQSAGDARLSFHSPLVEKTLSVSELQSHPFFDCGGVGRFLQVDRPPRQDGPRDFSLQHEMECQPGAYWIRVLQVDQSIAWASPIYVA